MRGSVAVPTNNGLAGLGNAQFRTDNVHNALVLAMHVEEANTGFAAVLFKGFELQLGVLIQNGILTPAQADEISSRVASEMQEAVTFALNSPFPKLESALEYNFA